MNFYLLNAFVKKIKTTLKVGSKKPLYKTFDDLEFNHLTDRYMFGVTSRIHFDNGFGASVVSHSYSYGGDKGLYELAVLFDDEIHYDNPVAMGDVKGYLKPEDVTELLIQIQKL